MTKQQIIIERMKVPDIGERFSLESPDDGYAFAGVQHLMNSRPPNALLVWVKGDGSETNEI